MLLHPAASAVTIAPPRAPPEQVNFRVVELAMQEASMNGGGSRFAPGTGRGPRGVGRGRGGVVSAEEERADKVYKEQLVNAARGFMRAITLGKKKWSALVQQVGGWVGLSACLSVCLSSLFGRPIKSRGEGESESESPVEGGRG